MNNQHDDFINEIFLALKYSPFLWTPGDTYKYVIHIHYSNRVGKHYDLRIENDNHVLTDFATRKNPLVAIKSRKIMLFKNKDHPYIWLKIKGNRPSGLFEIYDRGNVAVKENKDDKTFVLQFNGIKMKGCYVIRYYNKDEYLFFKTDKSTCLKYEY
jgi:hypothetical protein